MLYIITKVTVVASILFTSKSRRCSDLGSFYLVKAVRFISLLDIVDVIFRIFPHHELMFLFRLGKNDVGHDECCNADRGINYQEC